MFSISKHSCLLKKVFKCFHNEKGSVLVFVALSMFFLIGLAALVVDAGALYEAKREMATAADAAALAGAKELKESNGANTSEAKIIAEKFTAVNGAETYNVLPIGAVGSGAPQFVDVTCGKKVNYKFAKIFKMSINYSYVNARAVATWSYLTISDRVIPFYYIGTREHHPTPGEEAVLKVQDGKNSSNWGIFDLQSHGLTPSGGDLILRGDQLILDPPVDVDDPLTITEKSANDFAQPGKVQAYIDALDKNFGSWEQDGRLVKYHTNPKPEPISMIGFVPIVSYVDPDHVSPNAPLCVNGFMAYEIQDVVVDEFHGSKYANLPGHVVGEQEDYTTQGYEKGTIIGQFLAGIFVTVPMGGGPIDQDIDSFGYKGIFLTE